MNNYTPGDSVRFSIPDGECFEDVEDSDQDHVWEFRFNIQPQNLLGLRRRQVPGFFGFDYICVPKSWVRKLSESVV